jgi:hypothetical protein
MLLKRDLFANRPCPRRVARNRVGHVIHEAHWQRSALTPARGWGGLRRCRVDMGRCQHEACIKSAVSGGTPHCKAHGGGKRCQHEGCDKSAQGSTQHCSAHGGGRRCKHDGCSKAAQGNTQDCVAHGGGKHCQHAG